VAVDLEDGWREAPGSDPDEVRQFVAEREAARMMIIPSGVKVHLALG
jgi:hypothetical protein